MKLFSSILLVLLLLVGCTDDTANSVDTNIESVSSTVESATLAREAKASCLVDKGFDNEIDCYEGEPLAMKKRCDSMPKIAGATITYTENSGCPTNRKYIGCCATVDSTQCYYLAESYETNGLKVEWINDLKNNCISYGDRWEK